MSYLAFFFQSVVLTHDWRELIIIIIIFLCAFSGWEVFDIPMPLTKVYIWHTSKYSE